MIDADTLTEEFKKTHDGKRSLLIDTAPSVDAVPVVRCKDCRHWCDNYCKTPNGNFVKTHYCDQYNASAWSNWFCAHGEERRDDGSD